MHKNNYYLLLDKLEIQNANAISSPLTYGFPALSGFLGAMHALNRKLKQKWDVHFASVLLACHQYQLMASKASQYSDYMFHQSRNPLKKDGKTASIIQEGKIHLTVSLVIKIQASHDVIHQQQDFFDDIKQKIQQQRIAGGSVLGFADKANTIDLFAPEEEGKIKHALLPAFILQSADKQMQEILQDLRQSNAELGHDSDLTGLDALIDLSCFHHIPGSTAKNDKRDNNENIDNTTTDKTNWRLHNARIGRGWLVPMPVGFQSISDKFEAGKMHAARTEQYPSQYVECLYGLGKWVFPLSLQSLDDCFWQYQHQGENLYLITTNDDN